MVSKSQKVDGNLQQPDMTASKIKLLIVCDNSFLAGFYNNLSRLEEENGNLSEVEVDEMLGLMCDVAAEVTANNAVPSWVVFFVELLLDEGSNVFLDIVFLERLRGAIYSILLHLFRHVGILDNCFSLSHFDLER